MKKLLIIVVCGLMPVLLTSHAAASDWDAATRNMLTGVLNKTYLGCSVVLEPLISVTCGSSTEKLILSEMKKKQLGSGFMVLLSLKNQEAQNAAGKLVTSFQPALQHIPSRLFAIVMDSQGNIQKLKSGQLDTDAVASNVVDFYWPDEPASSIFPQIKIIYSSIYSGPDWYGQIRWTIDWDMETMSPLQRFPMTIARKARGETEGSSEMIKVNRLAPGEFSVEGAISKQSFVYECPEPCIMAPAKLFSGFIFPIALPHD
jgi:hypothetical protein